MCRGLIATTASLASNVAIVRARGHVKGRVGSICRLDGCEWKPGSRDWWHRTAALNRSLDHQNCKTTTITRRRVFHIGRTVVCFVIEVGGLE